MSLEEHTPYFQQIRRTSISDIKNGDVIQFTYNNEQRFVMVLEINDEGTMHGMSLDIINHAAVLQIRSMLGKYPSKNVYEAYIKPQTAFKDKNGYRKFFHDKMSSISKISYKSSRFST